MKTDILLITPPLTQLNSPYPATTQLLAYLRANSINAVQYDLSIDLADAVYSRKFLSEILSENKKPYINLIEPVKAFIRSENPTLSHRICSRQLLPEGSRFNNIEDLDWWFGSLGENDMARHLATLFLLDISDFIRENVCPFFGVTKYAERISISLPEFDKIEDELKKIPNPVDNLMLSLLKEKLDHYNPRVVGFTVPFPGNLYAALRCGKYLKEQNPEIKIVLGGGYINTELRTFCDPAIFQYADFLILDDGELPLLRLMQYINDKRTPLLRTFIAENSEVKLLNNLPDTVLVKDLPPPDYTGIEVNKYLSLMELPNPMHSLWSNGFWNKIQLARGCYWAKCAFCDTSLPYISNYDASEISKLVDNIQSIIHQTSQTGFHFVDEAAPPSLLRKLSEEIIKRDLIITWWTNIRFEKNFTPDLCKLMSDAGCIAVSGGIEVASNRLLNLMNKGVTVEQAATTCKNFQDAGIMVHAYLMYGFPSESEQETIDSLEVVRQFFKHGLIQSGFWHRYAMTCHSPTGKSPQNYEVKRVSLKPNPFANNEVPFIESVNCKHGRLGKGLEKSIYNYMHGVGIDDHVSQWFDFKVALPTIPPDYIAKIIGIKRFKDKKRG
ncbi:MAG: radical SAM protein [Bacteroidales bacterium]|nr:radical SAM protein [Bacteroidales bacterium]